ncbi:uncharacterized protein LOC141600684 [Silene latifolia]|uniref:uncharacterized protein LOC141600684 n=1 Tax=Silene latifolia TaxID=37657 RepID=UPI003D77E46D
MAHASVQEVRVNNGNVNAQPVDEIETFLIYRYVLASETCWRMFVFEIQYKQPPVQRLTYHLESEQDVFFDDSEAPDDVLNRVGDARTTLTEWMTTNQKHEDACELTYAEFLTKWIWDNNGKEWTRRQKGFKIGRIYFANPNSGESYYLRLLLNIVKGAKCIADLRTVDKVVHPTYKSACNVVGLLDGDDEWHVALNETASWATAQQLREMFATLLLFCEVTDPKQLWLAHWKDLSDDILPRYKMRLGYRDMKQNDEQIQNYALLELEIILNRNGRSLKQYADFPTPDKSLIKYCGNSLLLEEQIIMLRKLQFKLNNLKLG